MIPLYHDFTGETVLIFGGGAVGARKARRFAAEARVVVVSPDFGGEATNSGDTRDTRDVGDDAPDDRDSASRRDFGDAELVRARPGPGDVEAWIERTRPALVVAATDDERVNDAVTAAGRDRGALVNRADRSAVERTGDDAGRSADSGVADVVVPATVTDGDVSVAISTGGRSPALAKYLREEIEETIEDAEAMAALTAELRAEMRASDLDPSTRRAAIRAVVRDPQVWKALRTGVSNARQEATRVIRNTRGGDR
ncbi:NAD(P)-dependent oxidoreductase [Halobellus sp. GM3]|uniref:NAD(P)-dependent oxidoreductase n=1 Tax=Halobellus sp. GM3 TaxID=3458410 RepID=UPI00403D867F